MSIKANNFAIFDSFDVIYYFSKTDGRRYSGASVVVNCAEKDCLDQYRDLTMFFREYKGQELSSPLINYTEKKIFYPFQVFDLTIQVNLITSLKIQLINTTDPAHAILFIIKIRLREIKRVPDGNNITESEV